MNAENELRVWAGHLAGQSLTIIHREVPFDSAGRSAVLTQEEFDRARSIPCFATDGPVPSSRDFLPAAYTVGDWLCCVGLSTSLVEELTSDQRETLALDLRGIGGPFNITIEEFAARMGANASDTVEDWLAPLPEEVPLFDGEAAEAEDEAFETLEEFTAEVLEKVTAWGDGGFQHPDAVAALGVEEADEEAPADDMLSQFGELTAEDRAEFVLEGALTREQLDELFNVEANGRKSKKVLSAISLALGRFPNKDAHSINQALMTASAGPRQIEE